MSERIFLSFVVGTVAQDLGVMEDVLTGSSLQVIPASLVAGSRPLKTCFPSVSPSLPASVKERKTGGRFAC